MPSFAYLKLNAGIPLAAYVLLIGLSSFFSLPSFMATVIASPLVLLMPIGVGLFICFALVGVVPVRLNRGQALLIAYLVGCTSIVFVYVVLERYGWLHRLSGYASIFLCSVAVIGYLRTRQLLILEGDILQTFKLLVCIGLPLLLLRYLDQYVGYFDYPILDLFQRTHFHKGAFEFANFDTVNPFVADSYIPLQQISLGLLIRFAHVDPLIAEWVLPVVMEPLKMAAVYVAVSPFAKNRFALGLSFGLGMVISAVSNPTNGSVAELAALVLISLLWPLCWRADAKKTLLLLAGLCIAFLCFRSLLQMPVWQSFIFFLILALLGFKYCKSDFAVLFLSTCIVVLVMQPIHRGSLLFGGLIIAGALIFATARFLQLRYQLGARFFIWINCIALGILTVVTSAILLAGEGARDEFGLWRFFDYILRTLIGKTLFTSEIDGDLIVGVGGRVALFEMGRTISLFLIAGCVLLLLADLCREYVRIKTGWPALFADQKHLRTKGTLTYVLFFVGLFFIACILSGFPFIHRAGFIPAILVCIVFANLASEYENWMDNKNKRLIFCGLCLSYVLFVGMALLAGAPDSAKKYIHLSLPLLIWLAIVIALVTVVLQKKHLTYQLVGAGFCVILLVLYETTASKAYFKAYAYGNQVPTRPTSLAHYDEDSLAVADKVRSFTAADTILVSDPKSLALLKSRTGLNSLVTFTNLDTMAQQTATGLRAVLMQVRYGASGSSICAQSALLRHAIGNSEKSYGQLKQYLTAGVGWRALSLMGYNNALLPKFVGKPLDGKLIEQLDRQNGNRLLIVYSPDTEDWLTGAKGYFPVLNSLPADIKRAISSGYNKVQLYKNAYIIELECK